MDRVSVEKAPPEPVILSSENDKQIVLYDPIISSSNGSGQGQIVLVPEPNPSPLRFAPPTLPGPSWLGPPKVLPAVGSFTVQCARCFKWRLIPTKEKYEQIREHILEVPFSCEVAKEWKPESSCGEPGDLEQDGSRLWAIDKPSISKPPSGWQREVRIRAEGGSKFADVYYMAPSGKRLRSMVEVQRYLLEHPEYIEQGVTLSQFSFQIPKPLHENYVRKRASRATPPAETTAASPISWAPPDDHTTLHLGTPGLSRSYFSNLDGIPPPSNKKARSSSPQMHNTDPLHNQHRFKIKGPRLPPSDVCDF